MTRVGAGLLLAGLAAGIATAPAAAQRVEVEIRAGAAVGNYSETGAGLELVPGPSFGAAVELWPRETLATYLGINRSSFGCEEGFCEGGDVSITSQGVVLGGRWAPGLPWVRAGVALQWLHLESASADEQFDPGLGFEAAAGLQWVVSDRLSIRPGVTYRRHAVSTDGGDHHAGVFALEVGGSMELRGF